MQNKGHDNDNLDRNAGNESTMTDLTNKSVHHLSVALQCWAAGLELSSLARNLLEEAAATIEALSAELEKAREVISRLPKTADGVSVGPGDTVYHPEQLRDYTCWVHWDNNAWEYVVYVATEKGRDNFISQSFSCHPQECYSTIEAAERAMQQSKEQSDAAADGRLISKPFPDIYDEGCP